MARKLPRKDLVIIDLGWTGATLAYELTGEGLDAIAVGCDRWPDAGTAFPADYVPGKLRYAIRLVLESVPGVGTGVVPTAAMPHFGRKLNHDRAAAVATYIRTRPGQRAPASFRRRRGGLAARCAAGPPGRMTMPLPRRRCAAPLAIALLASAPAALAADPQALSTFVPVQTQDALVVKPGQFTLQGYGVYTRDTHNSRGDDLLNLSPTLKVGPLKGVQVDISVPYSVGNQSTAGQGAADIDAYYQFTEPSPTRPALALQAGYQVPYGAGHKSNQYFVRALATQWLGSSDRAPRLHLNLNFTQTTSPGKTGRRSIPEIGVAYSQLVSGNTALVVDVVHGAKSTVGQNQTIVDLGLLHDIGEDWAVAGGIGVGIGQQSPDFRLILAVQRNFKLF